MPDGEHRAGKGSLGGEELLGQTGGQTRILHPHLDGHGAAAGDRLLEQFCGAVAQRDAAGVVQDDGQQDQQPGTENRRRAAGDHDDHHKR